MILSADPSVAGGLGVIGTAMSQHRWCFLWRSVLTGAPNCS
jgi:hypothetical protein